MEDKKPTGALSFIKSDKTRRIVAIVILVLGLALAGYVLIVSL